MGAGRSTGHKPDWQLDVDEHFRYLQVEDVHQILGEDFGKAAKEASFDQFQHEYTRFMYAKGDIDHKDGCQRTALHRAIGGGHYQAVEFLLRHGASVHTRNKLGSTPLHIAAHFTGADPESRHYHVAPADEERMAPALTKLMCCALVDAGADINAQDESGWTPLMAACVCGHAAGVRCLLTLGADVNIPTKNGVTPLEYACRYRRSSVLLELLAFGARPFFQDAQARLDADQSWKQPLRMLLTNMSIRYMPVVPTLITEFDGVMTQDAAMFRTLATPEILAQAEARWQASRARHRLFVQEELNKDPAWMQPLPPDLMQLALNYIGRAP